MIVLFFIGNYKPLLDLEIDFEMQTFSVWNRLKTYRFDDVLLYSYNKRHHQVRLWVKHRLIGFSIDQVEHRTEGKLTPELAHQIGQYGLEVAPKKLYNYSLLITLVWIGLGIFYIVVFGRPQQPLFGSTYIPTYYAFVFMAVMSILTVVVHNLLLVRMSNNLFSNQDTSEN
jgi:hypothetical protein